jgi:hypothetical protein
MLQIFTIVARTADFIPLQAFSLQRLTEPYLLTVVNNDHRHATRHCCQRLGVECWEPPNNGARYPSEAHAKGLNDAWQTLTGGRVLLLDMDIFLLSPCSPSDWLAESPVAAVSQQRGAVYPWPGLFLADLDRIPDWRDIRWNPGAGRDTGGMVGEFLEAREIRFRELAQRPAGQYQWELIDERWLHYGNGSNWRKIERPKAEMQALEKSILTNPP